MNVLFTYRNLGMAKLMTIFIFCIVFNSFLLTFTNCNKSSVTEVINVLGNIVEYFKRNYQHLNFEAHFALRVVEGQFKLLLLQYNDGKLRQVPANVMTQLRYLNGEAAKTANMAVPHLLEYDKRAFTSMRYQVQNPWMASLTHRLINNQLRLNESLKKPKEISEDERNICIVELAGVNNNNGQKCATTLNCLEMMTAKGQRGFSLQHQIFYTALAEQIGCKSSIEEYLASLKPKTNLDQLQRELCTNVYYELMKTVEYYGIQPSFAHLFLLIEFNCPSLGFFQFLSDDWLDLILQWQNSNGCTLGATNDQVTQTIVTNNVKLPNNIIVQQEDQNIHPSQQSQPKIQNQNQNANLADQHRNIKFEQSNSQQNYINNQYANHIETGYLNNNQGNIKLEQLSENANLQGEHNKINFQQQSAWFPHQQNIHLSHMDYGNQIQNQNIPNLNFQPQYHPHVISGSDEIAHAQKNALYNQNGHEAQDVHEVVHVNALNRHFNPETKLNAPFNQYDANQQINNQEIHKQRRSLLQIELETKEVTEDDDHGYFFDREKHIGGNSTEKHVYYYYYPMHEQMKKINAAKEKFRNRKFEREKKKYLQRLSTRKLLKDVTGNCNMQLTGLAACVLTMYIRFMVDPGPPEFLSLRLNKPEGQYDLGAKNFFEENEPEEPLYVPKNGRNLVIDQQNVPSYHVKDRLYPIEGGFKPLYFGDVRKKLHPEENDDYVRKAESPKQLVDKAFESETRVLEKPNNDDTKDAKKETTTTTSTIVINTQNKTFLFNSFFAKSTQLAAFNKHLPTELGYHLLLIIFISLICVYILFRYFRFKRRSRFRTKYI